MLKALIERFVTDHYPPGKRASYRVFPAGYCVEVWSQLAETGVLAAPFSPEQSGLGGGAVDIMVLMEALGRGLVVEPVLEQVVLPGRLIAQTRAPQQAQAWLQRIMAGDAHVALAHFEHGAGFDLSQVSVTARRGPAGVRLDGEKAVVLGAGGAEAFIVSARELADPIDARTIGFYLVDRNAPGVQATEFRLVDGSVACKLGLHEVVPSEKLDISFDVFAQTLDDGRLAACAEMIGIMSVLFEATLEYVRSRKQFGTTLGSFQVIQHRLADLYVLLEQSRSQLWCAALKSSEPPTRTLAVAGMKSYISAAAIRMGEECIHLHGGMGITDELMIGHGHKRLLVLSTMLGDADWELQRYACAKP